MDLQRCWRLVISAAILLPAFNGRQEIVAFALVHLGTFLKVKNRFPPNDPSAVLGIDTKLPPGW
jgi:hypothetical protein